MSSHATDDSPKHPLLLSSPSPSTLPASHVLATGSSQTSVNEVTVYWLDVTLLLILAVFFLCSFPRAIARFSRLSEISRGLFLRTGSSSLVLGTKDIVGSSSRPSALCSASLDDSSSAVGKFNHRGDYQDYLEENPSGSPPWHVQSVSTILYPISSFFSYSITSRETLGEVALALAYYLAITLITFISSNPFSDPAFLGYVAVAQIPVSIALGAKNNIVGMLVGMGYERASQLLFVKLLFTEMASFWKIVKFSTPSSRSCCIRHFQLSRTGLQ